MTTVWKGTLEFGDVSVPVRLTVAAREEKLDFSLVNPVTGNGVSQKLVDASNGVEVKRADLVRAADVDGRTVLVTEEELASVAPEKSDEIIIERFVKSAEVDPLWFSGSYYVLPNGNAGNTAYQMVTRALGGLRGHVAIGKMVRLQRQHHVLVRATEHGLMILHTLYRSGEVRSPDVEPADFVTEQSVRLARSFIRARAERWDPTVLIDQYRLDVLKLLAAKALPTDLTSELKTSVAKAKAAKKQPT